MKKNTFGRLGNKDVNELPVEEAAADPEMDQYSKPAAGGDGLREDPVIEADGRNGRPVTPRGPIIEEPTTPGSQLTRSISRRRASGLAPVSGHFGGSLPHARSRSTSSQHSTAGGTVSSGADQGVATIRLSSGAGFPPNANVQIRIREVGGKKDLFKSKSVKSPTGEVEWDEAFMHNCTADQQFKIFAKDNHTFGRDEELGEGLFVVDDTGSGQDTTISVGGGKVVLRTTFRAHDQGSGGSSPRTGKRSLLKR